MKFTYPHTAQEIAANEWEEITDERADYLLNVLPPAVWKANAFAVGEPLTHARDTGQVVYDMVVTVDGKHYCKPEPLATFDPTRYTAEIREQAKARDRVA